MSALIEKELVFRIIGCAMTVHNALGPGLREKTYENALCVEFQHQGVNYLQQSSYPVFYREVLIDQFVPDLVAEGRVVVDNKTVDSVHDAHRGTMLNYLRITGIAVGLIINFKNPRLEWERLVLDEAR